MKKVWVLEGLVTKQQMEEDLKSFQDMRTKATTKIEIESCDTMIRLQEYRIDKYPEGRWLAYQGKTNYKQFCYDSKQTLRNMKKHNMQWRVVEGAIQDNATTWVGYKITKENEGVMKYLWATL